MRISIIALRAAIRHDLTQAPYDAKKLRSIVVIAPLYCKHPCLDPVKHPTLFRQARVIAKIAPLSHVHLLYRGLLSYNFSLFKTQISDVPISFYPKNASFPIQLTSQQHLDQTAIALSKEQESGQLPFNETFCISQPVAFDAFVQSTQEPKGVQLSADLTAVQPLALALNTGSFLTEALEIASLLQEEPFIVSPSLPTPSPEELSQQLLSQKVDYLARLVCTHLPRAPYRVSEGICRLIAQSEITEL